MKHLTTFAIALGWLLCGALLPLEAGADPADTGVAEAELPPATQVVTAPTSRVLAPPSPAGLEFGWSAKYASRYTFQGFDYSEGRPVFQPSVSASLHGFTGGLWGNLNQPRGEVDEYDATLQREFQSGPVSGSRGYAYLRYPHREWAPTHETTFELSIETPLAPSLSPHWGLDAGAGRYWTFALGHQFERSTGHFGLCARLHAQEHYYGMTGIPALETGVSYARTWSGVVFEPSLARQWTWANGGFRDELGIEPGWVASLSISPN